MRPLLQLTLVAFALAASALGQQTTSAPPPTTLRARARLVVVDVTVTDSKHNSIRNLPRAAFTLLEDKTPQTITEFQEHTALSAADAFKFPPVPPLPPGVFTNFTPTPENAAVNILLLDTLNTPLKDQAYVHSQLLDYVKKARPGASVAVFSLTTELHLLQGFTSDPEVLRKAVEKSNGRSSPLLDDAGGTGDSSTAANIGSPATAQVAANMANLEATRQSFQYQARAKFTLDAMNNLARYLASIPGRKNLIWFSGSFPLNILPDGDLEDPFRAIVDAEDEYRETTNLLAGSQVAVYPIDARGLMTLPMFDASQSGPAFGRNPGGALNSQINKFTDRTAGENDTMRRMAHDTGGEAFVNTNGLSQAVGRVIDNGANYYTLAYSPTNTKWKGDFRRIQVNLASKQGYTLSYRRGYYAVAPSSTSSALTPADSEPASTPNPTSPAMKQAMIHGLPQPTEVVYKVRVMPASIVDEPAVIKENLTGGPGFAPANGPFRRYAIDFAADPSNITFFATPDGHFQASIEFVSIVYNSEGKPVVVLSNQVNANLTADRVNLLRRGGIPFHQEISVPIRGTYTIRTGVHDIRGNHVGAVELDVAAIKNLPALNP